jgi:hypothetical protein
VLGLLAVLFGVAWLIGATGALHLSTEGVVAVGLMLLGASLVVTGRTDWSLSRRSWPVWLGAALIVVLVATSTTFGFGGALSSVSFGDTNPSINAAAPPHGTIHGGFGNLNATVSGQPTSSETVKLSSVAGRTIVDFATKPSDKYHVAVKAHVFGGQICVDGHDVGRGVGASNQRTFDIGQPDQNSPTLTLDVHQMFGQIRIHGQGCAPS